MENDSAAAWPRRTRLPDLASLDEPLRGAVLETARRLRAARGEFGERFLLTARQNVPEYDLYTDDEIRDSAHGFVDIMAGELESYRVPDDALRETLVGFAHERVSRGMSMEALAVSYQLGSREMLELMDRIAAEVDLPPGLLLAVHDSTWEFSNEASAIFAQIRHDLAVEGARLDAERRSAFARGVLTGSFTAERIALDAPLFGLDSAARYVAVVARGDGVGAEDARRGVARALRTPADRLLFAELGSSLGCIAARAPVADEGRLVAVGPRQGLEDLHAGFEEAETALATAERFGTSGVVRLADLGPRPLVLAADRVATGLEARLLARLDAEGRSGLDVEETTRLYLEHDQRVGRVAERLTVHPNTVRYRVNRFRELTGLDVRRTEDLVTAWWLLHRRRAVAG
ncbi:CdaR family transcriptional regulator [Cellulomonas sp. PhB143]|uniref:PucR family transcriptional regulator n=1 Tax=Cellulomonas sp. PhB143 TaxID=2485186 RepID=UPI000F464DB7|nr:helix-turn-helix domain-containing protein [Cellulomonas sp. PhB143]ROS78420.1 DNA-binding PucR family transcriptional regulator [Cellulomonas sp. PhB143]